MKILQLIYHQITNCNNSRTDDNKRTDYDRGVDSDGSIDSDRRIDSVKRTEDNSSANSTELSECSDYLSPAEVCKVVW